MGITHSPIRQYAPMFKNSNNRSREGKKRFRMGLSIRSHFLNIPCRISRDTEFPLRRTSHYYCVPESDILMKISMRIEFFTRLNAKIRNGFAQYVPGDYSPNLDLKFERK